MQEQDNRMNPAKKFFLYSTIIASMLSGYYYTKEQILKHTSKHIPNTATVVSAQEYAAKPITIGINPGHDRFHETSNWGAEDRTNYTYEYDLNLDIARKLEEIINRDVRFRAQNIKTDFGYTRPVLRFAQALGDTLNDKFTSAVDTTYLHYSQTTLQDSVYRVLVKKHNKYAPEHYPHNKFRLWFEGEYLNRFDLAIHIHHNSPGKIPAIVEKNFWYKGFEIFFNPQIIAYHKTHRKKELEKRNTRILHAIEISKALSKVQPQNNAKFIPNKEVYRHISRKEANRLRKEYAVIPRIGLAIWTYDDKFQLLIECDYVKAMRYIKDKDVYFAQIAQAIYEGIRNAYQLAPLPIKWGKNSVQNHLRYEKCYQTPQDNTAVKRTFINK